MFEDGKHRDIIPIVPICRINIPDLGWEAAHSSYMIDLDGNRRVQKGGDKLRA